jgi:hypothetical protein
MGPAWLRIRVEKLDRDLLIYLLGLATRHGGRLATFDRGIPLSAVRVAKPANLCIL